MRLPLAALAVLSIAADPAAQVAWTRITLGTSPSAQSGNELAYDEALGVVWMLGIDSAGILCETWSFDGTTWKQAPTNPLPARIFPGMVYDSLRNRVVLFGGWDGNLQDLDETWEWDGQTWTRHLPATSPPARVAPYMAYDSRRGVTVLYGGSAAFVPFDDTWEWDGINWVEHKPTTTPGRMSGRDQKDYFDMCFDENLGRSVLTGGVMSRGTVSWYFAETWEWDGTTWQSFPTTPWGSLGGPRRLAYDSARRRLVSAGPDSYERDGRTWINRLVSGVIGPITYDRRRSVVVLFGSLHQANNETWEYGPINPARYSTYGAGCPGSGGVPSLAPMPQTWPYLGDAFTLDVTGLPSSGPLFAYLGASRTQWHGYTLPLALGAFGLPGCTLLSAPDAVVPVPRVSGGASLAVPIPNTTALVGKRVYGQIMAIDPPANPAGAVLSDAVEATIGSK